jgi:phytoene/squalene synthetase
VLRIAGYRDDRLDCSSDALCTALQLTNFWQDFGRDWQAGRLYVPDAVRQAAGADERQLGGVPLPAAWVAALGACVAFTKARYEEGRAVCEGVPGRLGLELRVTWLGGRRILERADRARPHLLGVRPTLGVADVPALLWHAIRWKRAAPCDG